MTLEEIKEKIKEDCGKNILIYIMPQYRIILNWHKEFTHRQLFDISMTLYFNNQPKIIEKSDYFYDIFLNCVNYFKIEQQNMPFFVVVNSEIAALNFSLEENFTYITFNPLSECNNLNPTHPARNIISRDEYDKFLNFVIAHEMQHYIQWHNQDILFDNEKVIWKGKKFSHRIIKMKNNEKYYELPWEAEANSVGIDYVRSLI